MVVMLFPRENRSLLIVAPLLRPLYNILITPTSPVESPSVCFSGRSVRCLQVGISSTQERLAYIVEAVLDVFEIRGGSKTCYKRLGWRGAIRSLYLV
jgi:hypothetical protein